MLVGLLALARFALAAAAWDTGNGFALMGAARELMIAVFGEALLRARARSSRRCPRTAPTCAAMSAGGRGLADLVGPDALVRRVAFALVILVETGRQPIDNPDTHLELTMIHEGPLLEYAGPRPRVPAVGGGGAPLGRARARRRAVPAAPARASPRASRARPPRSLALCAALALIETLEAKMRILRVPALLGVGCAIALAGAGPVDRRGRRVSGGARQR